MSVRVITDSDTGLQGRLAEKFSIVVLPHYLISGGRSYNELDLPRERMIGWLNEEKEVTTSHPTVQDYISAFETVGEDDDDILYVPISSQYSKAHDIALAVRERLSGLRIEVVDSKRAAGGHAMFALEAARLAQGGEGIDAIVKEMERMDGRIAEIMVLDSLRQLAREGRTKGADAALISLVSAKLLVTNRGLATPIGKARTNVQALDTIIAKIKKDLAEFEASDVRLLVEYGTDEELADRVKERLASEFSPSESWTIPTSPAALLRMGTSGWSVSWAVVT